MILVRFSAGLALVAVGSWLVAAAYFAWPKAQPGTRSGLVLFGAIGLLVGAIGLVVMPSHF